MSTRNKEPIAEGELDIFDLGKELESYVPGFKVEVIELPGKSLAFATVMGELDDRKKKITIKLWPGATRNDALAILAHEYSHLKEGTTVIEKGLTEPEVWHRGERYTTKWGALPEYLRLATDLVEYYGRTGVYPKITAGIKSWLAKREASPSYLKEPFIKVGERVRFIGTGRHRRGDWPEGKWLEYGVTGTVTEYHPEQPTVIVRGERFEALPPYAVVTWDLGGTATSVIDPEDEGKRWERIEGSHPRAKEFKCKYCGDVAPAHVITPLEAEVWAGYHVKVKHKELIPKLAKERKPWSEIFDKKPLAMPMTSSTGREGQCYELAWRYIAYEDEGTLVHGEVWSTKLGRMVDHAWVVTETGYIYEPVSDQYFNKNELYKTYKMREINTYSPTEARKMALVTKNFGPWTDKDRQKVLMLKTLPSTVKQGSAQQDDLLQYYKVPPGAF